MAYNPNAVFISPSTLSDFDKCPQLYYYKAVYRAPSGLKIQIINPAIALGQVVHETIDQVIKLPAVNRSKDKLLDIYEFLWKTIEGEKGGFMVSEVESKRRGLEMITRFWANGHFKEAEMVKLPIFPKVDLGNNLILTGKLDWIEKEGYTYHVIDFKTGKNEEKAESMQLPIYAVLACGILKTFDIRTSYWYLDREDSLASFPLPDINETTRLLVTKGEIIQKARKDNSFKCQSGKDNCYACRDIQAIAKGFGKLVAVDATNYKQEIYILPKEDPPAKNYLFSDKIFDVMKWLIDPSEYTIPNPRIDGWKKLKEVSAKTVKIYVFPLEAFDYFLKNNKLPQEFEDQLLIAAREVIDSSPEKAALVRRAYVVPGLENPPGPRFVGLNTPEKIVEATRQLFEFAIKQNYHQHPESQISGWIETPSTVLDLPKFEIDPMSVQIPYGGNAVNENGTIEVLAVYGMNEGVQSLVADRYVIEARRGKLFILRKEVPQKTQMLCTTNTKGVQLINVPVDLQFDQVLSDAEIVEIARVTHELSLKYGPQRVEYSTISTGICFNEVANYYREEKKSTGDLKVTGKVLLINGIEDLNKLLEIPGEKLESGEIVVLVGDRVVIERDYDVLGSLTTWKNHMFVLYPGVASTQHAVRVLADKGHKAFLIGNQKYSDGDEVQISSGGGKVRVTNLTRTESQETMSLWDALIFGNEMCGGKAYRLSQLKTSGFQVPHGAVCTTVVFDKIINMKSDSEIISYLDTLLPEYRNSKDLFAVRSSATIEDGKTHSMAGMFDSYLDVCANDLSQNILKVIRSINNPTVTSYLSHHPELSALELKMAVVIQQMIPAKAAGVIFGAKTQTHDTNMVEIEVNNGLGEAIVSGSATEVEYYRFSRYERKMVERKGPKYITEPEARALFMLSERLREMFSDIPQDIEWAIDKSGQIWVLQSRDMNI